jgi:DNA polymerase-3 subunit alpha
MVDDYIAVKHGTKKAEYKHPVLKEVLEETNGVMVYQEQVMRILNRLGGIPLAAAYTVIKAISKKKESTIAKNYEKFIEGAVDKGMKTKEANEIWELIIKFAGYGFNKSHSTAYALIAYQTAYLKAHYPVEFMAALLSGDIEGRNFKRKDSLVEHMEDCQRMQIEVVAPDVNTSYVDFAVGDGTIFFGLSAIKSCGGSAAESIVAARKAGGPFKSIFDFCERVDPSSCGRATVETLIKAGAFDSLGAKRRQLIDVLDRAIQSGSSALADRRSGQKSLFGAFDDEPGVKATIDLPNVPEYDERERLLMEKEVLGYYLKSHPLAEYEKKLAEYCSHTTAEIAGLPDGTRVMMGGMLSAIKFAHVKNAKPDKPTKYANFDLEDMAGAIRCILWPTEFATAGELVQADAILAVCGRIDRRGGGDEANLIVDELIPLDQLDSRYTSAVIVRVDEETHGAEKLNQVREVVRGYPGGCELQLVLSLRDGTRVHLRSNKLRVAVNGELRGRIDELLGPGYFGLITSKPAMAPPSKQKPRRGSMQTA